MQLALGENTHLTGARYHQYDTQQLDLPESRAGMHIDIGPDLYTPAKMQYLHWGSQEGALGNQHTHQ